MAQITKYLRTEDHDTYALVYVMVDQTECSVYVGGRCEVYHDSKFDKSKAFVMRPRVVGTESLPITKEVK